MHVDISFNDLYFTNTTFKFKSANVSKSRLCPIFLSVTMVLNYVAYIDINKSVVYIIIQHVDLIYHACRGQ